MTTTPSGSGREQIPFNERECEHCKGSIFIRMPVPSSKCDHLYYPDCCPTCKEREEDRNPSPEALLRKENAKLLREREEIIQQLATERDAFGKREIELMQKYGKLVEAAKTMDELLLHVISFPADVYQWKFVDEVKLARSNFKSIDAGEKEKE